MKAVDTMDRVNVEGKVRHYQAIIANYEGKYSASYESYSNSVANSELSSEMEDDLLDWKEAILMLSVYERLLSELPETGR